MQYDLLESDPTLTSLEPEENVNVDLLMTYLVNPWTAVYVGYNTNYRDVALMNGFGGSVVGPSDELTNNARQLFVKGSYLFRF